MPSIKNPIMKPVLIRSAFSWILEINGLSCSSATTMAVWFRELMWGRLKQLKVRNLPKKKTGFGTGFQFFLSQGFHAINFIWHHALKEVFNSGFQGHHRRRAAAAGTLQANFNNSFVERMVGNGTTILLNRRPDIFVKNSP